MPNLSPVNHVHNFLIFPCGFWGKAVRGHIPGYIIPIFLANAGGCYPSLSLSSYSYYTKLKLLEWELLPKG